MGRGDYVKIKEPGTAEDRAAENADNIKRAEEGLEYNTQTS